MKKRLIVGPAGSGKTELVLNEFKASLLNLSNPLSQDHFFLLPSLEHAERVIHLLIQQGLNGFFHRRVTTLSHLTEKLLALPQYEFASNTARYLTMREVLEGQPWPYFEKIQSSPGLTQLMLSFIRELKESMMDVDTFRAAMEFLKKQEPSFQLKYESLAAIYGVYEETLARKGLKEREDAIRYLEDADKRPASVKRFKTIWLDGFFDFSNLQMALIDKLSEQTDEIVLTLSMEAEASRRAFFETVGNTEKALLEMGFEKEELCRPQKRTPSAGLNFLEERLFSDEEMPSNANVASDIQLIESIGQEGEVEMIARSVAQKALSDGFRYSDFCILLRSIGNYAPVIRSVMKRYGIPVEIHERERLSHSPLIEVVKTLLSIFSQGWKRRDVLGFLKSKYVKKLGEVDKSFEWVCELEHQAIRQGIYEGRETWFTPWKQDEENSDVMKKRLERLVVLEELEDALRSADSIRQIKEELIKASQERFGLFSYEETVAEHVQRDALSYRRFLALLDEIESMFLKTPQSMVREGQTLFDCFVERLFRIMDLDLYSFHPKNKNCVQVYDISLARQKQYRMVFIAGMLEKSFPVQIKEDPVLSDWERKLVNGQMRRSYLKERVPRQSLERYLFYVAVTRAQEKLVLSYPRLNLEGKEFLTSYYVEEVKRLFKKELPVSRQKLSRPYPLPEEAIHERDLELGIMGALREADKTIATEKKTLLLLNHVLQKEDTRNRFQRAFYNVEDRLDDSRLIALDPFRAYRTSPTRLEDYARCSFRYYAGFGLRLFAPEEDRNIKIKGTIVHKVLEDFFKDYVENPELFKSQKSRERKLEVFFCKALAENPLIYEKNYQRQIETEETKDRLRRFIDLEYERLQSSPLKPKYFEWGFNSKGGDIPSLKIVGGRKKVEIRGKIDRIDLDDTGHYAAVIDYKSAASFKKEHLKLGISLQLPLYALVAERLMGLKSVSGELYSVKDGKLSGYYLEDFSHLTPHAKQKSNKMLEAEYQLLLSKMEQRVLKYTEEMSNLKIPVRPRDCVSYCPYSAVCRIEKWKLPMILEEIKNEEAEKC